MWFINSRADGRYRAMIGGSSDDQSHEQRPGEQRKNYKNRQKGMTFCKYYKSCDKKSR